MNSDFNASQFYGFLETALQDRMTVRTRTVILPGSINPDLAQESTETIERCLCAWLTELSTRALTDQKPAEALFRLGYTATRDLHEVASLKPDMFREVAPWKEHWPTLLSPRNLTNKGVKNLREKLRGLGVGTQGPWKLFGKSFDPEKPINDVAGRGVICLKRWQIGLKTDKLRSKTVAEIGQWVGLPTFESQQRLSALDKQVFKLPRFCKKTWKGWAKLLWKLVLIDTKDEPEKHPFWAQAGAYRKRWHDLRIKSKERDQAKNRAVLAKLNISSLPKKASRPCPPSIIRNGARTALFQAIRIIAPAK